MGGTTLFPLFAAEPGDPSYDFQIPPTNGPFHLDLSVGQEQERELFGDLWAPVGEVVCLEVKADFKCGKTGNVPVEFEYRTLSGDEKPSGISVTKAHHWVFVIGTKARVFVETERLKELARRAINDGRHAWIGDGGRFHNALVPLSEIARWD